MFTCLGLAISSPAQQTLWTRLVVGATHLSDSAFFVATGTDDRVFALCNVADSNTTHYMATACWSPEGLPIWVADEPNLKSHGRPATVTLDGGIVVGGSYRTGTNRPSVIIKYSSSGAELWRRTLTPGASPSSFVYGIDQDSLGNLYVAGATSGGSEEAFIAKLTASGLVEWSKLYVPPGSSAANFWRVDCNEVSSVTVAGSEFPSTKAILVKYNSAGAKVWDLHGLNYGANGLVLDSSLNAYLVGSRNGSEETTIAKFSASGAFQWDYIYNEFLGHDYADSVVVAPDQSIYVGGVTEPPSGFLDIIVLKLTPSGQLSWLYRFNSPGDDGGGRLALDSLGNICCAGMLRPTTATVNGDPAALKLLPDGRLLWSTTFEAPVDGQSGTTSIAIDSKGDIVIGGSCVDNAAENLDALVWKISNPTNLTSVDFSIGPGRITSGVPDNTLLADSTFLELAPTAILISNQAPIVAKWTTRTPILNPSTLIIRSRTSAAINVQQTIRAFNFNTNSWETMSSGTVGQTWVPGEISIPSPARFISATGEIRVQASYKAGGPVLTFPWLVQVDQMGILYHQ